MENESNNGKVPLISKIAYGFGDVGCNFSWMFVSNFLMIFYTDVFGISMAAVSALILFSRFWDAINDPIVGGLTDKTNTRWGRYRPWLLVAAPITSVLLILSFWAHPLRLHVTPAALRTLRSCTPTMFILTSTKRAVFKGDSKMDQSNELKSHCIP